jgi:hypothetical protein
MKPWRSASASTRPRSSRLITAPVGLPGVQMNSSWQRAQAESGIASRSGSQPLAAEVGT